MSQGWLADHTPHEGQSFWVGGGVRLLRQSALPSDCLAGYAISVTPRGDRANRLLRNRYGLSFKRRSPEFPPSRMPHQDELTGVTAHPESGSSVRRVGE